LAKPRRLQENQRIHSSVIQKENKHKTKARLPPGAIWDPEKLKEKGMIEKDPYAEAGEVFSKLLETGSKLTEADYSVFDVLSSSREFIIIIFLVDCNFTDSRYPVRIWTPVNKRSP
jgi:hypothetical protein